MPKLVIIDGNALVHRAYHALPRMTDSKGRLVNAVYGFSSILLKVLKDIRPEYAVATFDLPGKTFRHKMYKDYKAHRPKAKSELYEQFPLVRKVLTALNIPIYEKAGYEADDIIGTISSREKTTKNIIVSGDLDTLQLVNENTIVLTPGRGVSKISAYNRAKVKERFQLKPSQIPDLKGLNGDPSDNIPGVKGIGEKSATLLLKKYKTIESVYANLDNVKESLRRKLEDQEETALFSKALAKINTQAPIKFSLKECLLKDYSRAQAEEVFLALGFQSLLGRLPVPRLSEKISEIETSLEPILRKMERRGVLVEKKYLETLQGALKIDLQKTQKIIFKKSGQKFNILSPNETKKILKLKPELAKKIKKFRSLYKLQSSYASSLPALIKPDGRIHTTYTGLGAETGRLASSKPNLQNIPESVKKAFVTTTKELLVSADYSQIELRILASISEDEKLLQAFRQDKDVHLITAAELFSKPELNVTPEERQQAKTLNFSIIYGISPYGLAKANNISIEEAQSFIGQYFHNFSGVARYIEEIKKNARETGFVETLLGRKRYIDSHERGWERIAINHPIQGTQADIIKLAMIKCDKELKIAKMILQVHDELVFEVKVGKIQTQAKKIKAIMENIFPLKVPLKVDIKAGKNWGEMEKLLCEY